MKSKSRLVVALNLTTTEAIKYLGGKDETVKKALYGVIFYGHTYKKAGDSCGITKCAIYDHLIRIYKKKYGVEYANKNRN